jgi:hypothetical protein
MLNFVKKNVQIFLMARGGGRGTFSKVRTRICRYLTLYLTFSIVPTSSVDVGSVARLVRTESIS